MRVWEPLSGHLFASAICIVETFLFWRSGKLWLYYLHPQSKPFPILYSSTNLLVIEQYVYSSTMRHVWVLFPCNVTVEFIMLIKDTKINIGVVMVIAFHSSRIETSPLYKEQRQINVQKGVPKLSCNILQVPNRHLNHWKLFLFIFFVSQRFNLQGPEAKLRIF